MLGGVFVIQRDVDGEAGALALLAFHLHPAAVAVDDLLHHGQAHAEAAALAVAAGIGAPEAREHHAGLLFGKADAGVAHGNGGHDVALLHRHRDVAALRRVTHGVGNQIRRGLADHIGVAHHHDVGLGVVFQGEAGIGHEHLMGGDDARD